MPGGEAAQLGFAAWLREQHATGAVGFEFKDGPAPDAAAAAAPGAAQGNIAGAPVRAQVAS